MGTEADALLAASGANADHGKKRTRKDINYAVEQLLLNNTLCRYSNNRLAREAKVSPQVIEKVRQNLERAGHAGVNPSHRIATRNGSTYSVAKAKANTQKQPPAPPSAEETANAAVDRVSKYLTKTLESLADESKSAFIQGIDSFLKTIYTNINNKS